MNRLLIILFGIVSTVSVAILLFLLYRYAVVQNGGNAYQTSVKTPLSSKKEPLSPSRTWLEELALKKNPTFSYAVSEMEIELPLKKSPKPETVYRLILEDLDDYKMFCVRQMLARHHIRFSVYRKKKKGVLMIQNVDRHAIEDVISLVKRYKIKAKIVK